MNKTLRLFISQSKLLLTLLILAALPALVSAQTVSSVYSSVWGTSGEKWTPTGPLPDYSFAGYHNGEAAIPTVAVVASVKDYGAKGDGVTDDTAAINKAISSVTKGAILFPAGTYKISNIIYVKKPGIVLRGEGHGVSILKMSKSLTTLLGDVGAMSNGANNWCYIGGTIWIEGSVTRTVVGNVTVNVTRGTNKLTLSSVSGLSVGSSIRLEETDPASGTTYSGTLAKELMGNVIAGSANAVGDKLINFDSKITAISGNTITLERYLPVAVKTIWNPQVVKVSYSVKEVGVEDLQVCLPDLQYPGHFNEQGYNGLYFNKVADCWSKNVEVRNGDTGISISSNTMRSTMQGFIMSAYSGRPDASGYCAHQGIAIGGFGHDNLITGANLTVMAIHDLSLETGAMLNVFEDSTGKNISMDHHGSGSAMNLYTNIQLGGGTHPWQSGGSSTALPHAAAYETFWNIRSTGAFKLPPKDSNGLIWGPRLNLIGVNTSETAGNANVTTYQWHFENMPPAALMPQNIHRAQLNRRLKPTPTVTITSPSNGSSFIAPSSITLSATATPGSGSVTKVEFISGSTILGTATASPYSANWTSPAAGSYSITAKVTDSSGATAVSSAVSITVKATNVPPSVSISSPGAGAVYYAPANISISANATDSDGSVKKVEFYEGSNLIGSATAAPFSMNWTSVPAGTYSLTAKATDDNGAVTTSGAVSITVKTNLLPTVSITSPSNNASFTAGDNITITASASDSDGTIAKVVFYNGSSVIGTDTTGSSGSYSYTWSSVSQGSYTLKAVAYDNVGASKASSTITITVARKHGGGKH